MHSYTFFGRVTPEKYGVNISDKKCSFTIGNTQGTVSVWVAGCQLISTIELTEKYDQVADLVSIVHDETFRHLSLLGFTSGYRFDVEVATCIDSNGKRFAFGTFVEHLVQRQSKKKYDLEIISKLTLDENGIYLRRALEDLCRALKPSFDSGLYIYRAVEVIRNFFMDQFNIDRNQGWKKMRHELNVCKEDILYIKSFADKPRHGRASNFTGDNYAKMLLVGWDIMDKFIEYGLENWQNTPKTRSLNRNSTTAPPQPLFVKP